MDRKINSFRAIMIVAFVTAVLTVTFVFLSKKDEIEIQRMNNLLSQYQNSILKNPIQGNIQDKKEEIKEWELKSGDPNDICSIPVFQGKSKVNAWYVYGKGYENKNEWLLKIADGYESKLPLLEKNRTRKDFHLKVKLQDISDELENKLKKASQENPVEVEISAYLAYCDGIPLASLQSAEKI
jgi:hypothetical protein